MAICQQCQTKWTWKETFRAVVNVRKYDCCPYCGSKQYPTRRTRNNLAVFPSVVAILWIPMLAFDVSLSVILPVELAMAVVTIGVLPFFYHVTDCDEPMW